jgi:pullulanase
MSTRILLPILGLLAVSQTALALRADWVGFDTIKLSSDDVIPAQLLSWSPAADTLRLDLRKGDRLFGEDGSSYHVYHASRELELDRQHIVVLEDGSRLPLIPADVLDHFIDYERMGHVSQADQNIFRLFQPRARSVKLNLYARPDDDFPLRSLEARRSGTGTWEAAPESLDGVTAWTWSLEGPHGAKGWTDHSREFADPWSTAVASQNTYVHQARSLIVDESHDWVSKDWRPPAFKDLIIYEAHLRDMTAGEAAGLSQDAGSYTAFIEAETGGLAHLRQLGITAVEFLPLQDFGNIEIDYDRPELGIHNTWNPWERNHWGYMTSYFLAPESWYASGQSHQRGEWSGLDGRQAREFKQLVDACHQAGIAVMMDVVYNHVSQYDNNPLKALDPAYWFHLDDQGNYTSASGCGNDLNTARPMSRRLILDSIRHFVEDYHIDGFRFDLGAMIDSETLGAVRSYCHSRGVFLTAEPWGGGGYDPPRFAGLGWSWWNDVYRVDMRGRHPSEAKGFLFGERHPESGSRRMALGLHGNAFYPGAINRDPLQSVNYIAAHDDHCLGDWVRIALGRGNDESVITDPLAWQTLTEDEFRVHGIAALHLLTSGGIPMIHAGQELAQGKVITTGSKRDDHVGRIDHNSYEKDTATNWIDWRLLEQNAPLLELYQQAIALRRSHPGLADARRSVESEEGWLRWTLEDGSMMGLFHSAVEGEREIVLPWKARVMLASGDVELNSAGRKLKIGPRSAVLLEPLTP